MISDLGGGVWQWDLPHPEWRPNSERVNCYVVRDGANTVVIDPLFGEDTPAEALDELMTGTVTVAISIPYHVRSAAEASQRWDARIVGHPDLAKRLPGTFEVFADAAGVELLPLPQHKERPVAVGDTLTFGDRFVGIEGGLRIWAQRQFTDAYRERLRGFMAPLLERDFERVLVGHGEPVLHGGKAALAAALDAEVWTGD